MEKTGKIIVLNGVSSSGKSTLARAEYPHIIPAGDCCDLVVDTAAHTAEECAGQVAELVAHPRKWLAFAKLCRNI